MGQSSIERTVQLRNALYKFITAKSYNLERDVRPGEVYSFVLLRAFAHRLHGLSTYASCALRIESTRLIRCSSSRARYCRENYGQDLASSGTEFDFSAAFCADRLSDFMFCAVPCTPHTY